VFFFFEEEETISVFRTTNIESYQIWLSIYIDRPCGDLNYMGCLFIAKEHNGDEMSKIVVRLAEKKDISEILEMVKEFSQGHLSEGICRDGKSIETAFFNDTAVGELIVAERDSKVVGS
jgi:hypothetical protein